MATIKVTCSDCGDIELRVGDIHARICIETAEAEYRFSCDCCEMTTVKQMQPRTLEILAAAGVHVDEWSLPAELTETHDGLTISHNDIIEFHDLMSKESEFEAALAALDL